MDLLIAAAIALIAALWVASDAKKRGMDPWGWGLFVFLLLIIGLPVYLINRKPLPGEIANAAIAQQNVRRIPAHLPIFNKDNYRWMLIGLVVIAIGMFLLSGGKNTDPNVFDRSKVYSSMRITIAPLLILAGLVIEIFAVFRKPSARINTPV